MAPFEFKAKDRLGNHVTGTLNAQDPADAMDRVRQLGYEPEGVRAVGLAVASTPANGAPAVAAPAYSNPRLVDLTAPVTMMPVGAAALIEETGSGLGTVSETTRPLEPWERGSHGENSQLGNQSINPGLEAEETQRIATQQSPYGGAHVAGEHVNNARRLSEHARPIHRAESGFVQEFKEKLILPILSGVAIKELAPFYRQFAALINSGIPLFQTMVALEASTQNVRLKAVAVAGQRRVQEGGKFSEVMTAHPWIFDPMQCHLVRAAEMGGMLDETLKRIADYVEHELAMRRLISRETLYPKIVLFVALMILGPGGMTGGSMAFVNLVMGTISPVRYLEQTIGFMLLCIGVIFAVTTIFRLSIFNAAGARAGWDRVKMALPGVGKAIRMFALAKFGRTFAALSRAGFAMGSALEIAGDASGNAVIASAARAAVPMAERGGLVSQALQRTGQFPEMAVDMFRTGETAGRLDDMLDRMADYYEAEAASKAHMIAMIFGTVVFLIVALLVGVAILQQYGALGRASTTLPE